MGKISTKSKVAAATIAGITLGVTGVAYAYWTTNGSGSGTGSTTAGTSNQLTFTQNPAGAADTSVALAPMYPGDSAQSLTVRVRNTSGESAYVSSVKVYITTNKTGCTGDDFLVGNGVAAATPGHKDLASALALTWTAQDLAAGGAANATGAVQFYNNPSADQEACKSATVTLNYVAS